MKIKELLGSKYLLKVNSKDSRTMTMIPYTSDFIVGFKQIFTPEENSIYKLIETVF